MVKTNNMGYKQIPANTGTFLPVSVSVFGVPNTGIPVSVYTGLETLLATVGHFDKNGKIGYNLKTKLFSRVKYDNLTVFD
jgi:hypothetical protein